MKLPSLFYLIKSRQAFEASPSGSNFFKWTITSLFLFIFVFSAVNSKYVKFQNLPTTGFKPQATGIQSDRSASQAITTAHWLKHRPVSGANFFIMAVVVTQLVERSLPIPEVCSSNPVIGKNLYWTFYCQLYWKYKKEAGNGPFLKLFHFNIGSIHLNFFHNNIFYFAVIAKSFTILLPLKLKHDGVRKYFSKFEFANHDLHEIGKRISVR